MTAKSKAKMPWYKRPPSPLKSSKICAKMHELLRQLDILAIELINVEKQSGVVAIQNRIREEVWDKSMYEEVRLALIGRMTSLSGSMGDSPVAEPD